MNKTRKRTAPTTQPTSKSAVSPLMIGMVAAIAILVVGGLIVLSNFK